MGVVGEAQGLFGVLHPHDADQRPECFLLHDVHVVCGAEQDGRRKELARPIRRPRPSGGHARALGRGVGDLSLDHLDLPGDGHGAEVVRLRGLRTRPLLPEGPDTFEEERLETAGHFVLDVDALGPDAHLAAVREGGPGGGLGGAREIRAG